MDNTRRATSPREVKLLLPGVSLRHLHRLSKCQNKSFTLTARQNLLELVNFKLLFFAVWSLASSLFRTDEQRLLALEPSRLWVLVQLKWSGSRGPIC